VPFVFKSTKMIQLYKYCILSFIAICLSLAANAQTDQDGLMMNKNLFCTGIIYNTSSWNKYWEGTNHRENLNLGTVSSRSVNLMGNYGIKDNLNLLFNVPYVSNNVSAGTLHAMSGLQDASAWLKWMPIEKEVKNGYVSVYLLGGASMPLSDYIVDYLPVAIGLKSNTLSGRLMVDYQAGNFTITASETYTVRGNTQLERNSYYTTSAIISDQVDMPNTNTVSLRSGYRSNWLIAELILSDTKTLGGFDITKNNMPFPSNRMNATTIATNIKYEIQKVPGLSVVGGASQVIKGRNIGQSTGFYSGIFYILNFQKKEKNKQTTNVLTEKN
jgi:hypothetical protein